MSNRPSLFVSLCASVCLFKCLCVSTEKCDIALDVILEVIELIPKPATIVGSELNAYLLIGNFSIAQLKPKTLHKVGLIQVNLRLTRRG